MMFYFNINIKLLTFRFRTTNLDNPLE